MEGKWTLDTKYIDVYNIKIQNFEGPLDLLFHLIEKNKFNIYDIPINDITDQYMEYLYAMNTFNIEIASEFIVMAATLLHIKSKMLLPDKQEGEEPEEDPRDELVNRIVQYKKIKEFAEILKLNEIEWGRVFYKFPEVVETRKIYEDVDMTINELVNTYRTILINNEDKINTRTQIKETTIKHEVVSLKEKMKEIVSKLSKKVSFGFSEMFSLNKNTKKEVVTGFIAVLELIRLKKITVKQKKLFSDIIIFNKSKKNNTMKTDNE